MTDTPPADSPAQTPQVPTPPVQNIPAQPQQPDNSAQFWQSQYDKQQQTMQTLQQQVQQMQQQISQPPQPPTQPTTQTQLDLNNWGTWKNEDGTYKQDYVDAVFHPDLPQDMRNTMLSTIDATNSYTQQQMQQQVTEKFGNKETLNQALAWAENNMPQYERDAMNQALQNPAIAGMALQGLRDRAEAGGAFTQQPPVSTEPSAIPTATNAPSVQMTPLVPGSPEAAEAVNDPRYRSDKAYQEQVNARLVEGGKNTPDMTRML